MVTLLLRKKKESVFKWEEIMSEVKILDNLESKHFDERF